MALPNDVCILLVEDSPQDAEMMFRALEKHHLSGALGHAWDGEQALDFLLGRGEYSAREARPAPRLVLLDLKLPKVDGFEVLRTMKSDERTRMIPVVVLTSSQEDSDLVDSYRLGVNSYIVKPVEFEKFHDAVRQLGLYWAQLNRVPR